MMLLALILRPLRAMCTSLRYLAASCVSLADARAWRPSLLMISTSRCCMDRLEMHGAIARAGDRFPDQRGHVPVAVGECADQHRQAGAGDAFDARWIEQLDRQVAGRRAIQVGNDQHAVAAIDALDTRARRRHEVERIVACGD